MIKTVSTVFFYGKFLKWWIFILLRITIKMVMNMRIAIVDDHKEICQMLSDIVVDLQIISTITPQINSPLK